MKWEAIREQYPNEWVLLDIITKVEKDSMIIPLDLEVVKVIPIEGTILEFSRQVNTYVPYHTSNEKILIKLV